MGKQGYDQSTRAAIERQQLPVSGLILLLLYSTHAFVPSMRWLTDKMVHLQYQRGPNAYGIGIDDAYFVVNVMITLTFFRSFVMQLILNPMAEEWFHIRSKKAKVRFAEQGWCLIYYSFLFIYGLVLYWNAPYRHNIDYIYIGWPHTSMTYWFKAYYLIAIGFWLLMIFVLWVEEKRHDHYQMFCHHIITSNLIIGSYYYYFTSIGHPILMIMDSVDVLLCTAKLLKYCGFSKLCDAMFVIFMMGWIILRHGVYNYLFYHAWTKSVYLMKDGECKPGENQERCWTMTVIWVFLALLASLQAITMVWMYSIAKVAYRVITGNGAEDVRSDEDDTDSDKKTL